MHPLIHRDPLLYHIGILNGDVLCQLTVSDWETEIWIMIIINDIIDI
jgi:hypothetical protein